MSRASWETSENSIAVSSVTILNLYKFAESLQTCVHFLGKPVA